MIERCYKKQTCSRILTDVADTVDLAVIFQFIWLIANFGVNYTCKALYFDFYNAIDNVKHAHWLFEDRLGIIETC